MLMFKAFHGGCYFPGEIAQLIFRDNLAPLAQSFINTLLKLLLADHGLPRVLVEDRVSNGRMERQVQLAQV